MTHPRGRRPLACYHEAGHAVARWWLGFHSDDVVVLSVDEIRAGVTVTDRRGNVHHCEGNAGGYDIHMPTARRMLARMAPDDPDRLSFAEEAARRAVMEMVTSYAGPHAEARYTKRSAFECFMAGGMGDVNAVREVAAGWFATEDEQKAARAVADDIARALVRSPKGWAAVQAVASALLDRGRADGNEVDVLCTAAYGAPFAYDRWAGCWPPSAAQIRSGFLPAERLRAARAQREGVMICAQARSTRTASRYSTTTAT